MLELYPSTKTKLIKLARMIEIGDTRTVSKLANIVVRRGSYRHGTENL
jgi:hypothetical protein